MASPNKQPPAPVPTPSPTPAPAAVDSKPVVEAADLTPPAPVAKVVPANIPTPALISPNHDSHCSVSAPLPLCAPQELPNITEQKQPLAAEPESDPAIHPESETPSSENVCQSIVAISVEQQQICSEKIAEDQFHPIKTEPSDANQQAQSAIVKEIPAIEQSSFEKDAEEHPHSDTKPSNVKQQTQSAPVIEIPVAQQQSSSENVTQDLSLTVKRELQNALTNTGLDRTIALAEVETGPNPKITQNEAAAPPKHNVQVEPTPEKLPDETTNSVVPKPTLITETVSQEVPLELIRQSDSTVTNTKEDKITEVELGKPSEETQIDAPQTAGETLFGTDTKHENDAKNEVTAEIPVVPELVIEKQLSPVDDMVVPKLEETQQEFKPEPAKCGETGSYSHVSEKKHPVSGSEEEFHANLIENKTKEKPTQLNPEDKLPPMDKEVKAIENTEQQNTIENKVFEEETAEQNIPQGTDIEALLEMKEIKSAAKETNIEMKAAEKETNEGGPIKAEMENEMYNGKDFEVEEVQNNAATERAVEVKADTGNTFENEASEQQIFDESNAQKHLVEKVNRAESSPTPSSADTENVCLVIEKKETETTRELLSTDAEKIDKTQMHATTGTRYEPLSTEENLAETEKLEEREKPIVKLESAAQKEEAQTHIDTMLKGDDKYENAVVRSEEKVNVEESVSGVICESQVKDKTYEDIVIQAETDTGPQNISCIAQNPEMERQVFALIGSNETQRVLIKDKEEKLEEKAVASQAVACNIQEVSVSESSTVCDKDYTAQFDVGKNTVSKTAAEPKTAFENGSVSLSVASVSVAEPEIPVSVVSEQHKGPQEENTNMEETKAQPLGKPRDEDAIIEVTIVFSISVSRL